MKTPAERRTVDLSGYPDLVVIYLGMRVNVLEGLKTALSYGRPIFRAVAARPDGLLYHQMFLFSLFPLHLGIRQYWRDFEALERWARSAPHRQWWHRFLRGTRGTGFWHETYFLRGGMEAIYGDVPAPTGFLAFAPAKPARGALFSARKRLNLRGDAPRRKLDDAGLRRLFAADTVWAAAAGLWVATGLLRAFAGLEKGTEFYIGSPLFWVKMALLLAVVALEVWPMATFIRWRIARGRGQTPEPAPARAFSP